MLLPSPILEILAGDPTLSRFRKLHHLHSDHRHHPACIRASTAITNDHARHLKYAALGHGAPMPHQAMFLPDVEHRSESFVSAEPVDPSSHVTTQIHGPVRLPLLARGLDRVWQAQWTRGCFFDNPRLQPWATPVTRPCPSSPFFVVAHARHYYLFAQFGSVECAGHETDLQPK
ncbi:hypothetical protein BKA80DRAFT_323801 [Phyllosticta citrichinensis]